MSRDQDRERFANRVRAAQRRDEVPAVIAGVRQGEFVWTQPLGWADVDGPRQAQTSTQFRIGSITKTFTAAVVVSLALRGQLDLDEPAEAYLSGLDLGRVRVRHLLAHSAGVQREVPGTMWATMRGPDAAELRTALFRAEPVDRPGARWHYSNLGYAVLGQVVAALTGRDCRDVIDSELLHPLGLTATTWEPDAEAAVGYRRDPYRDAVHVEPVMDQGAVGVGGQLWSTVDDLLSWGKALTGGSPDVLPEAVIDAMHTLQVMVDTTSWSSGWGLGLILSRRDDRIVSGHTGAMPGFAAALSMHRATGTVATVLANLTRGADVAALAADLLGDAVSTAPGRPQDEALETWRPGPQCPSDSDGLLGRWWCEAEETVFTWRSGTLRAHLATTPETNGTTFARLDSDHYLAVEGRLRGEHLLVERGETGEVLQLTWATYPYTRTPR